MELEKKTSSSPKGCEDAGHGRKNVSLGTDASEIGTSLVRANIERVIGTEWKERNLWCIAFALLISLSVTNTVVYCVVEFGIGLPDDFQPQTLDDAASILTTTSPSTNKILESDRHPTWKVTDTIPLANLNDDEFLVYVGFVLWVTVVLSGLGLELLVWLSFLHKGWSREKEALWRLAQFAFPLLGATSLGLAISQNYLALVVSTVCQWKFGFPETLMYMYSGLLDRTAGQVERVAALFNGVGTVCHHSAASMLICFLTVGVIPADRHIVSTSLVLVMQHWFVLLRYVNKWVYSILELLLEVWFEWVVISDFEYIRSLHWTAAQAAAVMLTAHWLYLLAAVIELAQGRDDEVPSREENIMLMSEEFVVEETPRTTVNDPTESTAEEEEEDLAVENWC